MAVLNVTPDSFSDGGKYATPQAATDAALEMIEQGADLIDIGGESTRPGAEPVGAQEQIRRIQPVIQLIRRKSSIVLSIDTTLWPVAQMALAEGANWINDVSAGRDDPGMFRGVALSGAAIILMHRLGTSRTMQQNPVYSDVTGEVAQFLRERFTAATAAGIDPNKILLDPGIGFGKTMAHNLKLLSDLPLLAALGRPLVIGASRKSFIGKLLGEPDPLRRVFGDAAIISWVLANGASVVRVHDVGPMAQVVKMTYALLREKNANL
jgi:dihydropteroate synthase